jgi:ABC-type glycerol-3-phosphate transport system substrate-binding protein
MGRLRQGVPLAAVLLSLAALAGCGGGSTAAAQTPPPLKDMNTLSVVTPSLIPGPQQIVITNPDGEGISLDAVITAN